MFSPLQVVAVEEMIKLGLNPTLVFILQNHSSQHIENPIGNTIYSKIKKNDTENRKYLDKINKVAEALRPVKCFHFYFGLK